MSVTGNTDPVWTSAQTCRGKFTNLRSIFAFGLVLGSSPEPPLSQLCRASVGSVALNSAAER
jgi:hypothetical protein